MGEWWESRWLRRHAIFAPFGIFLATGLMAYWIEPGQWKGAESLQSAAELVDLAAVIYAMVAVLLERGVGMIFWALEERKKRRERWRAEGRAEGLAEAKQVYETVLKRVAREKGITLEELLAQAQTRE